VPARVNRLTNPSFETGTTGWTANVSTLSNPLTDGFVGVRHARLTATTAGAAFSLVSSTTYAVTAGQPFSMSAAVRGTVGRSVSMRATWTGATATVGSSSTVASLTAWQTISLAGTVPVGATAVRFDILVALTGVVVGTIVDVDACILEDATLGGYFDGDTTDTATTRYDWTSTATASTSTATPWIDASLVPSGDPMPVQLVITGIPNGVTYDVVGTSGGRSWPIPGGQGTSTGGQVILVDNRSALNTPVVYTATWGGVTYTSAPITVTYAGRYVIQSLDGRIVVPFVWRDNALPREYAVRSTLHAIPGRPRPAGRYATGGLGGGEIEIRTDVAGSAQMEAALLAGRPVIVRTDGTVRDLPPVDIVAIDRLASRSWGALTAPGGAPSSDRVWSIVYNLVDDPEPSAVLAAWTWDDFDDAMDTRTWTDHDALFASSTWDIWDTYPWGQL
jgi:hypothetical protein